MTELIETPGDVTPKLSRQEMRKIWNKNYAATEHGKASKQRAQQKFNEIHPEKRLTHYETYKETMSACAKSYYQRNKEAVCAKERERYHANKLKS